MVIPCRDVLEDQTHADGMLPVSAAYALNVEDCGGIDWRVGIAADARVSGSKAFCGVGIDACAAGGGWRCHVRKMPQAEILDGFLSELTGV